MTVLVNDVFEPVTDLSVISTIARLLYQDETRDLAVVIDLADPPRQPYAVGLEELRRSIASGHTKPAAITTPEFMLVLEEQLDERAKQGRDEKWAVIAPLLDPEYPGQIFVRGELGRLVSRRASELGIQRKTIYRLLYRYWFYGQVRNSLLRDAPINLSCSRGKLQFSRHLQRHWTKSDRKIMYGELFRPVLRVKREPHPYP